MIKTASCQFCRLENKFLSYLLTDILQSLKEIRTAVAVTALTLHRFGGHASYGLASSLG